MTVLTARGRAGSLFRGAAGRPGVLPELILLLLWFLLFTRLDAAAGKDLAAADANALAVRSTERALHIDIERAGVEVTAPVRGDDRTGSTAMPGR